MRGDATCFKAVYIVAAIQISVPVRIVWRRSLNHRLGTGSYVPDSLYLFCGRRADRIKGLVWEGLSANFFNQCLLAK